MGHEYESAKDVCANLGESPRKCVGNHIKSAPNPQEGDLLFDNKGPSRALLTALEVAHLLGVSSKTVYRWALTKQISCVKLGLRAVRFRPEDIAAIVDGKAGILHKEF